MHEKVDTVVIRFQICIFDLLNTASMFGFSIFRVLWFAFKFVSFKKIGCGSAKNTSKLACFALSLLYLWLIKYSVDVAEYTV